MSNNFLRFVAAIVCISVHPWIGVAAPTDEIVLLRDGQARLPIAAGSVTEPVEELKYYLKQISGADFSVVEPAKDTPSILVGLAKDFPWLDDDPPTKAIAESAATVGKEGFVLKSDGKNLYLIAQTPRGVQHAVTTFLQGLGCRWFFPGQEWEVVPRIQNIAGSWDQRQVPSFVLQREIWPAYGHNAKHAADWKAWNRHNRMGAAMPIALSHTGNGLKFRGGDFEKHPEWFALTDGQRRPTKPCYSHPEVLERAIQSALSQAKAGKKMISMSPPDGLGYCECLRCLASLKGVGSNPPSDVNQVQKRIDRPLSKGLQTTFGRGSQGAMVNVTSETLFHFVNQVATAVVKEHPDVQIGCYAYSAYSHPPSFRLHPSVYVQISTYYRQTPYTLGEQLLVWAKRTKRLGVREYYSVYQWDWDEPNPGRVRPDYLQDVFRGLHSLGVSAINAEASNNWAPRGLGYYAASHMMWNINVDLRAVIRDFYEKAFGPAALPMQRYYTRWYGPVAQVLDDPQHAKSPTPKTAKNDSQENKTNENENPATQEAAKLEHLRGAYRDLTDAMELLRVPDADPQGAYQKRVNHLRMYVHYLVLRQRLNEAGKTGDKQTILDAIKAETLFGGQLDPTNMIHVRPLIKKRFLDRFHKYRTLLTSLPADNKEAKQWRRYGTPPTSDELDQLWQEDGEWLSAGKE